MPVLEQRHLDLIGLALVAIAVFLTFVFYLGWNGGEVGDGLEQGLLWLFGGVAYLVPVGLLGVGTVLVLRPMLPSVRAFKAGGPLLLAALLLGLAAGSFGIGPADPPRDGFFVREHMEAHGGALGDGFYWLTRTLVQDVGTHILFLFLLVTGVMLLTGASVAGVVQATREGVSQTTKRVKRSTTEFAAVVTGRPRAIAPPEVEPAAERIDTSRSAAVVRATHVEAPALDFDGADDPEPEPDPEPVILVGPDVDEPLPVIDPADLTPQGRLRSTVTEADGFTYRLPRPATLTRSRNGAKTDGKAEAAIGSRLVQALGHFGVEGRLVGTVSGPRVTRYELRLAAGTKMSKVANLRDDLAYALAAQDVRILAPIPGKQAVGVEVPNTESREVRLGDVYQDAPPNWSPLTVWLGKDIAGKAIGTDIAKQPHLLVAGTTGSGKSVCVNTMLCSILLRATPNDVRLVLVDPKQVELNYYESIPHLLTPVITSPRLAANALHNLIREMEQRYSVMSMARARNLGELNKIRVEKGQKPFPYILCVIDELADLMMVAPGEVEDAIIRLAQKSRAVGIHLLLATQRPSADIITGLIKANVPARIAFAVSSQIDSRVILDQGGAESLLGQGDMLFRPATESRSARIQGAYISEEEIIKLTDHWRRQGEPDLHEELLEAVETEEEPGGEFDPDEDDLLADAIQTVVQMGTASTSMLQRRLRVGYTRAGRLIDMMERRGVISGYEGSKARQVLIAEADVPRVLAALADPVGAAE